jgi:hypothetical protein
MKKAFIPLLFVSLAVGCSGDVPTAVDVPSPDFAVAGNSGCYIVQGTISETGVFPDFSGTIDGDLVGTSASSLSLDVKVSGRVFHNPGERTLVIAGGNVPELVGRTIHEAFEGVSIVNAPPLVSINERTRVVDGAAKGNLTAHGTLNWNVFPWELEVEYRGVICP